MIKLPAIKHLRKDFFDEVAPIFRSHLLDIKRQYNAGDLKYEKVVDYFFSAENIVEARLWKAICGNRNELENIILVIGEMKTKRKSKKSAGIRFDELVGIYDDFIDTDFGQKWASKINTKTCPYCNRSYIFTLKEERVRPEYDHYFPKSIYPYLCVSMYNLIPSCSVCNKAKGAFDTHLNLFLYPFEEEFGKDVVFSLKPETVLTDVFERKYEVIFRYMSKDNFLIEKAQKNDEKLNLSKFYNCHKDYIDRLIYLRAAFTDPYLKALCSSFQNIFKNVNELKEQLFLYKMNISDWGEIILSKLTSDILDFLDGKYAI